MHDPLLITIILLLIGGICIVQSLKKFLYLLFAVFMCIISFLIIIGYLEPDSKLQYIAIFLVFISSSLFIFTAIFYKKYNRKFEKFFLKAVPIFGIIVLLENVTYRIFIKNTANWMDIAVMIILAIAVLTYIATFISYINKKRNPKNEEHIR